MRDIGPKSNKLGPIGQAVSLLETNKKALKQFYVNLMLLLIVLLVV